MTVTYFKCEEVEFEELLKSTASNRWRLKTNEKRQINGRKKKKRKKKVCQLLKTNTLFFLVQSAIRI